MSVFDLDYRFPDEKDKFLSFYQLFKNDSHFGEDVVALNIQRAANVLKLLKRQNELAEKLASKTTEIFLLEFLYQCICIHLNNAYELGTFLPQVKGSHPIGVGLFLTFSMASHSCAPNVMRIQKNKFQYWIVMRPISKGDQVLDNYGMSFQRDSRAERRSRSCSHYGFNCNCEACANDYPLRDNLKVYDIPHQTISERVIDYENAEAISKELRRVGEFLQQNDVYYPCQQLDEAEGLFWNLFRLHLNVVSMEYRFIQYYKPGE